MTPAPWRKGRTYRQVVDADGGPVASVTGGSIADQRRNRILIEAAPDMLAVLEELEQLEHRNPSDILGGWSGKSIAAFNERWRAALKKARP